MSDSRGQFSFSPFQAWPEPQRLVPATRERRRERVKERKRGLEREREKTRNKKGGGRGEGERESERKKKKMSSNIDSVVGSSSGQDEVSTLAVKRGALGGVRACRSYPG